MRQIDDEAINKYKIPRLILMEYAGLEVAKAATKILSDLDKKIFIFCGTGYNGGDGMVATRHLNNWGYEVLVCLVGQESKCKDEALSNLNILKRLGVRVVKYSNSFRKNISRVGLIIDAILGIGVEGDLRPPIVKLIKFLNESRSPILAVDVPSGLNPDTGKIQGVCIEATRTVTFTAPKKGFFLSGGPDNVGEVILKDIGIPRAIIQTKSRG